MKISVLQVKSERKNEFEIKYNDELKYVAKLPFISIREPLDLEKIRAIKVLDINENEVYHTDYKYIENFKEQFIPFKFLVTGSQKFNQLLFISDKNTIKIYYEEKAIWNNRYVIEINDKKYFCYSIEDGYIRHFPIYEGETQIGEALKSNVVIDGKDEYYCYLKDGYESLCDGIMSLLLYLDRSEYSSSYLVNRSYNFSKNYSYNKTNKYYDKEWVVNNFNDEFFQKVNEDVKLSKEKLKHPLRTTKKQWNSLPTRERKLMKFTLLTSWIMIVLVAVIVLIIFIFIFASPSSQKMVCKSDKGNITIKYNNDTITGFEATNISFDIDNQKEYAKQVGIDAYLDGFATWFSNNTNGKCER